MVPTLVTSGLEPYFASVAEHASGTIENDVLEQIEHLVGAVPLAHSVETGCGKSTILLSNLSARHVVFTLDDSESPNGSLNYVRGCPLFREDTTEFILGPTQRTVGRHGFEAPLDFAMLDGPHAYPFPELEYYALYPHLRPGALLIIDDVHIPTVRRLYEFVREDEMFEPVTVVRTTAFLRRTDAPAFSQTGDGWPEQRFNARRFPVGP
jgi:hypothetical protein